MPIKPDRWIATFAIVLAVALLMVLSWPVHVHAAPAADSSSNSCLTCHEDRYYLHDAGKYYCLSRHADHCVDCHQGNPTVMNAAASHQELIAYPQQEGDRKCAECHPQEVQTRLEMFASLAGYKTVAEASPYKPAAETTTGFPTAISVAQPFSRCLPWLAGAIVLFGLWLALVLSSSLKP